MGTRRVKLHARVPFVLRRLIMRRMGLFILMLLILCSSLTACMYISNSDSSDDADTDLQVFTADVIEVEDGLLITPDKDSAEALSSDKIRVAAGEAEIIDDKGNTIKIDDLKPGDRIRISYDGLIDESYPAQITADKIELTERNK